MAIDLKKLAQRTYTFTLEYAEQAMEVEYRPSEVTKSNFFEKLREFKNEEYDENILFQLETAIVHWELLDAEGNELKPTLELVRSVERPFWETLFREMVEDINRRRLEKKASNAA